MFGTVRDKSAIITLRKAGNVSPAIPMSCELQRETYLRPRGDKRRIKSANGRATPERSFHLDKKKKRKEIIPSPARGTCSKWGIQNGGITRWRKDAVEWNKYLMEYERELEFRLESPEFRTS